MDKGTKIIRIDEHKHYKGEVIDIALHRETIQIFNNLLNSMKSFVIN